MLKVYAVKDKAVGAFLPPFFVRAAGEAYRLFMDSVNDKQSPFFKHPGDFELYSLGEWDPATGEFFDVVAVRCMLATECVDKVA